MSECLLQVTTAVMPKHYSDFSSLTLNLPTRSYITYAKCSMVLNTLLFFSFQPAHQVNTSAHQTNTPTQTMSGHSRRTSSGTSLPPKPPFHRPPSPPQPPIQSPLTLYTLISSAPLQRQHLSHTLHTIRSTSLLLQSHASLLPFMHESPTEGPAAPFYATRTRITLLNLTVSLTQLLHDLVSQPWWPKQGQLFVQLRTQVETLRSAEKLSSRAGPERVISEINNDAKFFDILLKPLLADLQFALERAGADARVWSTLVEQECGEKRTGKRGERKGKLQKKGKRRKEQESESGLSAVRPVEKLSSREGEAMVMSLREKRVVREVKVKCEECGCEMTVEKRC